MTVAPERAAPAGTDPAERGRTDISPSVFRAIVEHVADQVPGTLRHARRLAGRQVGETGSRAKVSVTEDVVDVRLELTLQYPASVRSLAGTVRERVGTEITRLTGRRVRSFEVVVSELQHGDGSAGDGRRVR